MFHRMLASIREAVRVWKRRAALRQRRASIQDDKSIPF
jgi:hypothetical protein